MADKYSDYKRIRESTGYFFGMKECMEAYAACGADADKAIETLNAKKPAEAELTDEERDLLVKSKSDKPLKPKKSKREKEATVCKISSLLLFVVFVGSTVTSIISKSADLTVIILSLVSSVVLLVVGISIDKMTDSEYKKAGETSIKEVYYGDDDPIVCPHCGSTQLTFQKKGFSTGKAMLGVAFIGYWGAYFGVPGKNSIRATCLKCGHSWKIKRK